MRETARIVIPARGVRSLCWQGDDLIDWVGGVVRYRLDGSSTRPHVSFAYRFDAAVATPDGTYAVIYERLGTKGLVLKGCKPIREINRSFYHANVYEYPVALLGLPDGRTALVHCPEAYCRVEIDEIETGHRLTRRKSEPCDIFHSRLEVSPDGRLLLSAGWVWHPADVVSVFDIEKALAEPESLDTSGDFGFEGLSGAVSNAAFLGSDRLAMASSEEVLDDEAAEDASHLKPRSIGVYDLSERRFESMAKLEEVAGTLMPFGEFAVGFFEHPKLIRLATGEVVMRWPEIACGRQTSSIIYHVGTIPPIARDAANRRFAVAGDEGITVIQLGDG